MLDPCALMDTMFLALRSVQTTETYAIIECPITPAIPEGEIGSLEELKEYNAAAHRIHCVWDGRCGNERISFDIEWRPEQIEVSYRPTSMKHLMSGKHEFQLEPIDRTEAENALMLGGLDYMRVMETRVITPSTPVKFGVSYVGQMDPVLGEIPVLEALKPETVEAKKLEALPVLERDGSKVYLLHDGEVEATFEEVKPFNTNPHDNFEDDIPF